MRLHRCAESVAVRVVLSSAKQVMDDVKPGQELMVSINPSMFCTAASTSVSSSTGSTLSAIASEGKAGQLLGSMSGK